MRFSDAEAEEVKKWVVNKLEDISDADSDVLADYVLALIRTEAPDEEIRSRSVDGLEDFLREHTVKFVDELFAKFGSKPAPAPAPAPGADHAQPSLPQAQAQFLQNLSASIPMTATAQAPPLLPFVPPSGPSGAPYGQSMGGPGQSRGGGPSDSGGGFNRKRTFEEGFQAEQDRDGHSQQNRTFKTPRRGRGGGSRGDWSGRGPGPTAPPPVPAPGGAQFPPVGGAPGFPVMPSPFPPFDQNDPMAAMMALQGMGFPPMPGMPPMPIPSGGAQGQAQAQLDQGGKVAQRCPFYETQGICYLGATCPYQHGPEAGMGSAKQDEYDPRTSNIVTEARRGERGHAARGHEGRGRGRGGGRGGARAGGGRSEFSSAGPNEDRSITTIVVEQIPEDKFDETSVREFFSQFGEIVDISLQPYKRLALVKYDTYEAAKQAWSSPKVIFDNRFVKVYWHKPAQKNERNGGDRRATSTGATDGAHGDGGGLGPSFNKEEFDRQQEEAQRAYEEKMKKRKETEEARLALERQREELLKKQQEEKARLMQRLADKGGVSNGTAAAVHTDSANGGASADAANGSTAGGAGGDENVSEQTKQLRAQLAALEAEAKSLGIDPESATTHGAAPGGYRGRGRGFPITRGRGWSGAPRGRGYDPSYRGGGGGAYRGARGGAGRGFGRGGVLRLDNRPRRVAVSGVHFDTAKDEALRQYLIGIGEYESIEPNPDRPDSLIVAFKERYLAEKLMYGPRSIPSVGEIELTWVPNPPVSVAASPAAAADGEAVSSKPGLGGSGDNDTEMTGSGDHYGESANGHGHGHGQNQQQRQSQQEMDYDVAEEEDRWGVE